MSKLAIIFPREGPKSLNKAMVDISIKYFTGYFRKNNFSFADNGRQNVETLCTKIEFLSILVTFPPSPPQNNVDFSISSTAQTTAPTQH